MIEKHILQQYAEANFTISETAKKLGVSYIMVKNWAHKYNIQFHSGAPYKDPKERQRRRNEFIRLKEAGLSKREIIKALKIDSTTYDNWDGEYEVGLLKETNANDPRSKVCQQIQSCWHSRCYLAPRCPAYQNAQQKR